jgi:parallel beta-helix repeat protein
VENVTIRRGGRPGARITLRSAPGSRAEIDGVLYVADTANDVAIRWLTLNGKNSARVPSPQVNGDRVVFSHNRVTNGHTAICFAIGGAFEDYGRAVGTLIARNRIYRCGRLPATNHDHGIYVEGARGTRIVNNYIYENADWGIHLYPDAQGSRIVHNTLWGNGRGLIFAGESSGGEYRNSYASNNNYAAYNIIANSRRGYNVESYWGGPIGTGNLATRNCLWRGALGNIGPTIGFRATYNRVAPPRFVSASTGNFRLLSTSGCKGEGVQ